MKNFFKPSSLKIKIILWLILYTLIGVLFIGLQNEDRGKLGKIESNIYEKAGIIVAYPAIFLIMPLEYTSQSILDQYYKKRVVGEVIYNGVIYNPLPAPPTIQIILLSLFTGIIVEIMFLYVLACSFSFLINYKRKIT